MKRLTEQTHDPRLIASARILYERSAPPPPLLIHKIQGDMYSTDIVFGKMHCKSTNKLHHRYFNISYVMVRVLCVYII